MTAKWRKDGIRGSDEIIRVDSKLYRRDTTRCASSYAGLPKARRDAVRYAGKDGKVYKINNTYCYAVYFLYTGAQRPKRR